MVGDGDGGGGFRVPQVVGGTWPRWFNFKPAQWRTAVWLAVAGVAGLVILAARPHAGTGSPSGGLLPPASDTSNASAGGSPGSSASVQVAQALLDTQLAAVLEKVAGAGQVTVRVDLASGTQSVYATDTQDSSTTTQQTPSSGGTQTNTQQSSSHQVVLAGSTPVVAARQAPVVTGLLVVATGAQSAVVASELAAAAQAATGVPLYRVTVLPGGGGTGHDAATQAG